jgi:hypothetical protein
VFLPDLCSDTAPFESTWTTDSEKRIIWAAISKFFWRYTMATSAAFRYIVEAYRYCILGASGIDLFGLLCTTLACMFVGLGD